MRLKPPSKRPSRRKWVRTKFTASFRSVSPLSFGLHYVRVFKSILLVPLESTAAYFVSLFSLPTAFSNCRLSKVVSSNSSRRTDERLGCLLVSRGLMAAHEPLIPTPTQLSPPSSSIRQQRCWGLVTRHRFICRHKASDIRKNDFRISNPTVRTRNVGCGLDVRLYNFAPMSLSSVPVDIEGMADSI